MFIGGHLGPGPSLPSLDSSGLPGANKGLLPRESRLEYSGCGDGSELVATSSGLSFLPSKQTACIPPEGTLARARTDRIKIYKTGPYCRFYHRDGASVELGPQSADGTPGNGDPLAGMSSPDLPAESSAKPFEEIDWDATGSGPSVGTRTRVFLAGLVAIGLAFLYDYRAVAPDEPLVGDWVVTQMDWLLVVSLLVLACYLAWPLAANPRLTRHYWRRLRPNRLAVASLAYLTVFFVLGLLGPALLGRPGIELVASHQPPFGTSVPTGYVAECIGPVSDGSCYGTLERPFGTDGNSRDVLVYTVNGMQTALQVSLLTAMVIAPLAIAVGTVAAYFGGWVDEILMRYVDIQETIPPFFVYLVAQYVLGPSVLLIVAVFGLLDWGSVARLVRSEALKKREAAYVMAARSSGASRLQVLRRHLVPNVSHTVVTAVTLQMPTLILIEATLAFLGFGVPGTWSWGTIIAAGMRQFPTYWWVPIFPVAAMAATAVSFNLLGDALRDVLDPRVEP
jgi:peptide/nickel transport system permease protein